MITCKIYIKYLTFLWLNGYFVRFLLLTLYNIQKIRYNGAIKILEVSL